MSDNWKHTVFLLPKKNIFILYQLVVINFQFSLLSINNKLQNPEAANGVLMYAQRNSKVDYVCLYSKSGLSYENVLLFSILMNKC